MSLVALATTTPPTPTQTATSLATDIGGQIVDTVTGVAPVLVPTFLGLWAVQYVLKKLKMNKARGI
jgi:hypothetical protein